MNCQNCGQEIIMLPGAGPWVHVDHLQIECESPLYAEAEPESKQE